MLPRCRYLLAPGVRGPLELLGVPQLLLQLLDLLLEDVPLVLPVHRLLLGADQEINHNVRSEEGTMEEAASAGCT